MDLIGGIGWIQPAVEECALMARSLLAVPRAASLAATTKQLQGLMLTQKVREAWPLSQGFSMLIVVGDTK
jgi:hypothetical protein